VNVADRSEERSSEAGRPLRRPPTDVLVRDALQRNPDDVDALFVLAALHAQEGRSQDALTVLDRVLALDSDYPGAWFFKEKLHRMRGETLKADSARREGEAVER
jgi:tetratricopeptide (TPR) repeat protein